MRFPRLAHIGSLAMALAVTAGCSGPENTDPGAKPGAEGIRDVVEVYSKALADGDGPRACSLMSHAAQERLIARTAATDCLAAVTRLHDALSPEAAKALPAVEVTTITERGAEAADIVVSFPEPGRADATAAVGGQALHLARVDARWGIDTA